MQIDFLANSQVNNHLVQTSVFTLCHSNYEILRLCGNASVK